jgi:CubicO group peptidase (beta-lactamase class C family)
VPDFGPVRDTLQAFVRDSHTPGLQYVAVDQSTTVFEHHDGLADLAAGRPMLASTTQMAYSMSKTITAAAVLQLVERGRIGLDDPVARYLDWQPYGDRITVRQLLTHTSGTPNPLPLRWVHPAAAHATFDERAALMDVLRSHPRLAFSPGAKYAYSNIGYWLLGWIVARASDQSFTTYVETNVLRPLDLGPDQIGYTVTNPAQHATGYLEKYSIINLVKSWLIDAALVGDYAGRWLQIRDHYPNGPAFGGLVGSATAFARFLQDQLRTHSRLFGDATHETFVEPQHTAAGRPVPMTLGWHIGAAKGVRYFYKEGGGGGFHCLMRLYPQRGIGTVAMTNATGSNVARLLDSVDVALPHAG